MVSQDPRQLSHPGGHASPWGDRVTPWVEGRKGRGRGGKGCSPALHGLNGPAENKGHTCTHTWTHTWTHPHSTCTHAITHTHPHGYTYTIHSHTHCYTHTHITHALSHTHTHTLSHRYTLVHGGADSSKVTLQQKGLHRSSQEGTPGAAQAEKTLGWCELWVLSAHELEAEAAQWMWGLCLGSSGNRKEQLTCRGQWGQTTGDIVWSGVQIPTWLQVNCQGLQIIYADNNNVRLIR